MHKNTNIQAQQDQPCPPMRKRITLFMVGVLLLQSSMPAMAAFSNYITSYDIEKQLGSWPEFVIGASGEELYQKNDFVLDTYFHANDIDSFRKRLGIVTGEYQEVESDQASPEEGEPLPAKLYEDVTGQGYPNVGTPFVQSRFIRMQIRNLLGRHLINPDKEGYATEEEQIASLYNNAFSWGSNPGMWVNGGLYSINFSGDPISINQHFSFPVSMSPRDMIWPQLHVINGKEVWVPIVYLTHQTVQDRRVKGHVVEFNGPAEFGSILISHADVKLRTGRQGFLSSASDLTISGSTISSNEDLSLIAAGTLSLAASQVDAEGNLLLKGKSVNAKTLVHRYDLGYQSGGRFGEITSINTVSGDVVIRSHDDIVLQGIEVGSAQGGITLAAGGNIYVGPVRLDSHLVDDGAGGFATSNSSSVDYLVSSLSAQDTISIIANGNITLDAAEIASSYGHIELLAGLGISVIDSVQSSQSHKKGKFGKTSVEISEYKTKAMRSVLDAGKGIIIHSSFGDITLRAVDITSNSGTKIKADNGAVNLLITKETDHYSYNSTRKGSITVKTVSNGHTYENVVHNTIVGGLEVEALNGLVVEYKGDPDAPLSTQVEALAKLPGMEWMADLEQKHPNIDWNAVSEQHKEWSESNTSLSPAFVAVLSIAVAIAIGPGLETLAGNLASSAGGQAAIQAGLSTLATQFAVAAGNGIVNGDFSQAMSDFASSDLLNSLVTSMLTAGLLETLDADFFNIGENSSLVEQATDVLIDATVSAGIQSAVNGADFEDQLLSSIGNQVVSLFGKDVAGDIADADLNTLARYLAHIGLGCGLGSVKGAVDGSESTEMACASGAGGALIGELTADIYKELSSPDYEDLDRWKEVGVGFAEVAAIIAVDMAGGDFQIAGFTGKNAAENNALSLVEKLKAGLHTARCFGPGITDRTACFIDAGEQALTQSFVNDIALLEGLKDGLTEAGVDLVNAPKEVAELVLLIAKGEFSTVLKILKDSIASLPDSVIEMLDSGLKYFITADSVDDYQQVGESASALLVILIEVGLSGGIATAVKKAVIRRGDRLPDDVDFESIESTEQFFDDRVDHGIKFDDLSSGIQELDPTSVSFSQATIAFIKRYSVMNYDELVHSMKQNGWQGDPVDVVKMKDGAPTSADNTRILAAREAGVKIQANVHEYNDLIPQDQARRFILNGQVPRTWGEAIEFRVKKQSEMSGVDSNWPVNFPYGSIYDPDITGL